MKRFLIAIAALAACTPSAPPSPADAGPLAHMVRYSKTAAFEDIRDDLKAAIEIKGLKIDNTSHIHSMLERTGKDVGSDKKIFKEAMSYSFCSARVSRMTMEADPANVVFCPYHMVVYATANEPGTTYVAYRPLALVGSDGSKAALKEVNNLLDAIARDALGLK